MSSNNPRTISSANPGFLRDVFNRVRLIFRLMGDNRVNPLLKLVPVGAALYVLWPIDIPGPFDDAAVLWLGTTLFVELCPQDVVREHQEKLRQASQADWEKSQASGEVIDAEFRDTTGSSQNPQ